MSIMDLSARYDLPDMRQVHARIDYHEPDPVPCIATEHWREMDALPDLPGLREYLARFEHVRGRQIATVEVMVGTGEDQEALPFELHRKKR